MLTSNSAFNELGIAVSDDFKVAVLIDRRDSLP